MARIVWHHHHHRPRLTLKETLKMQIDPTAILALISDLTQQVAALRAENQQLRAALAEHHPSTDER